MNGIINFFKPRGMTSHDAVSFFRRLLGIKRIGHTGTLDPNATGVLPICIGKATRVAEYFNEMDKEYVGELTLGIKTDTQDLDGKVIEISNGKVTESEIIHEFEKFKGKSEQIPPMYSAVRHKGKKLYELAREGKTVERKPREINIKELKILNNYNNKEIIFYTKCSKGTYIRTLCNDIGENLNTHGFMSYLIRVGVGDFKIEDSFGKEYLESLTKEEIYNILKPMDLALSHIEEIVLEDGYYRDLVNGKLIPVTKINSIANNRYRIYCGELFMGIGRIIRKDEGSFLKIDKMLAQV